MDSKIVQLLEKHSLRKTDMRKKVLQVFLDAGSRALTNYDLEQELAEADRITLYRTLKTFEQKGLIHQAVDTTNATKYALCHEGCTEHSHHDQHAHFHCRNCGSTLCVDGQVSAQVSIPNGFTVEQTHLVLEGICSNCN